MEKPAAIPLFWFTNQDFVLELQFGLDDCNQVVLENSDCIKTPLDLTGYSVVMVVYNPDDVDTVYRRLLSTGGSPEITLTSAVNGAIKIQASKESILDSLDDFTLAGYQLFLIPAGGSPNKLWIESTITNTKGPALS